MTKERDTVDLLESLICRFLYYCGLDAFETALGDGAKFPLIACPNGA
jgi:hypothetical protein